MEGVHDALHAQVSGRHAPYGTGLCRMRVHDVGLEVLDHLLDPAVGRTIAPWRHFALKLRQDQGLYAHALGDVLASSLCCLLAAADEQGLEFRRHVPREIGRIVRGATQVEAVEDLEYAGH